MSPRKHDTPPAPPESVVPTSAVAVAKIGGTIALVAAAAMSAQTLYRLGRILGYAWWNAPLLPTSLDVYAATSIWVGHRVPAGHKARKVASSNARIALGLTVGANGLFHLLNLPGVHLPHWVGITLLVLVSALPPFVVERILHLQSAVSAGRAETRTAGNEIATPESDSANLGAKAERSPTATANPVESPTQAANDNRQTAKSPSPKAAANDNAPTDNSSANGTEALVAAALPAYRQILAATGKRPTAPALVAAVENLNTDSRAKQIREVIERRFPELAPRLRAAELVEQVS